MYKRWYNFLVKNEERTSLLDNYDINYLSDKLIICKQTEFRKFTVFNDYLDFGEFYIEDRQKSYYEIIFGEFCQKPHFDIDMDTYKPEIIEYILDSLLKVFYEKFSIILSLEKDIMIFTSHGNNKYSYHIIIDNYCSVSNDESKQLYLHVIKNIPDNYIKYIDHAVYNSRQQFRIMDSTKYGSDRYKKLCLEYNYKNKNIKIVGRNYFDTIKSSLISQTKGCKILTLFITEIKNTITNNFTGDLNKVEKILMEYDPSHKIVKEQNGIIILRHTKSYNCKICNSTHTSENPFLTVFNNKIFFHCRRANDKIQIGTLDNNNIISPKKIEIPEFKNEDYITDTKTLMEKMNIITTYKKKKINF